MYTVHSRETLRVVIRVSLAAMYHRVRIQPFYRSQYYAWSSAFRAGRTHEETCGATWIRVEADLGCTV